VDRRSRQEFEEKARRVDSLVQKLESLPDEGARRSGLDAVQALLDLHGDVLSRMLAAMGPEAAAKLAEDEAVAGLLLLHDLHPLSLEQRVARALEQVRPYMGSHGGGVEVLEIGERGLRLRLEGSCHGCPSSTATLKYALEEALGEHAPDLAGLHVEGVVEPPPAPAGFVALGSIARVEPNLEPDVAWHRLSGLEALSTQKAEARDVAGVRLLVCRIGDDGYAYRDACPACGGGFHGAAIAGDVIACPGCGRHYDVRHAGRGVEEAGSHLEPVPLLAGDDGVRVAVPAHTAGAT
jgi:Fe-S cluster biogenesis protein NfuA/nitrite reductase/ring-hydroxylating ferredoxin subunit